MGEIKSWQHVLLKDKYMRPYWKSRRTLQGNIPMDVKQMRVARIGEKINAKVGG
jgi:hypothetical protein